MINQTNEENNKLRGLSSHSFIIYIDYEILQSQVSNNEISSSYYSNLKKALDSTANYFSKLLTINGSSSIRLSSGLFSTSDDYIVRSEVRNIIGKTINADLILIPKIVELGESTDAAAYTIAISSINNRPGVGGVLLRSNYDFSQINAQSFLIMLLLHEVTHVLGFSNVLFKYFQTNDTLTKTKTINGIERTLFTGKNVIKYAKRHFGCDDIEGVELENQGGKGSAGSHWEARIMLGDYMISTDYQEIVISEISLALLEDSGWYDVNYYTGGLFRYGKGLGCNFLNTSCVFNNETDFEREFCVTPYEERCSAGNINRGDCYIVNKTDSIPSNYQYFNSETIGGFTPADYCPVSMSYSYEYYYFYSRCDSNGYNYHDLSSLFGETYGPNSLCILSSLAPFNYTMEKFARCHKITCNYDNSTFNVDIGDIEVECPYNYEEITVDGYSGSLICPGFDRVCTGSVWCNDPLTCIELESVNIDYKNDINENEEEEENYEDNYEDNTPDNNNYKNDFPGTSYDNNNNLNFDSYLKICFVQKIIYILIIFL